MGKDAADALPEIGVCATEDANPGVRHHAFLELPSFGRPAIPFLVKALHDTDLMHAIGAAQSLGEFGPDAKEAVPTLQAMLRHSHEHLRVSARFALQRIDPDQYPPPNADPE
jgi:HEAT repeat protein